MGRSPARLVLNLVLTVNRSRLLNEKGGGFHGHPFFLALIEMTQSRFQLNATLRNAPNHKQSARRISTDFLPLLGLVATVVWFCDDMLFAGRVPFFRDLGTYSYPIKFGLSQGVQSGELALWNRHMAAGFPLLAAFQPGVFYPPSIVFYLLPFFDAVRLTFFVHFVIAAVGAYYLCRRWEHPIFLSILGALLFAFGGTMVSLSNLLNHFQSAVWLPWMVLCWERLLDAPSWKNILILVLVLLCALLAGSPEIYFFSMGLLLIDGTRLCFRDHKLGLTRMILLLLTANALVAALGMVQFLPTAELLLHSRRDRPIPFQEATYWSLNPVSLAGILFPDKEADGSVSLGVRLFFTREIPFLLSHYLGVLSFLGILVWAYYASWKERSIVFVLVTVSLLLALGRFTPVYGFLFEHFAGFQIIRFPEKYFFLTFAFLVFVVLKGLAAFHKANDSPRRFPVYILFVLFLLWATAYSLSRLYPEFLSGLIIRLSGSQMTTTSLPTNVASVLFNLERQIAVTLALLLVFFCNSRKLLRPALYQMFLIAILLFDLGETHKPLQFLLDPDAVTKSNRILNHSQTQGDRLFYYPTGRNLHPSSLTVRGLPPFQKAVALAFDNSLPNAGILDGFDYFQEIDALTRQPYNDFLDFANLVPPDKRIKLLRALNIRYVVAFQPLDIPGMRLSRHFPQHFSWLYEIDRPVARAYVASDVLYESQPAKTIRMLASSEFDPLRQVILTESLPHQTARTTGGEAKIIRYENNNVLINASLQAPGVLVLTDSYYPGWKVFVDGKQSKILQANHFFRGVELAVGDHVVEFKYEPLSFRIGSTISLSTLFLLAVISLFQIIRWRKRLSEAVSDAPPQQHLAVQQE
jgi:hypothetical protein